MKPRVLIFGDNDVLRSTLKILLDESGYEVHTFSNPAMCPLNYPSDHDCLFEEPCSDIIISDVNMPVENGLDFIKGRLDKGCKVKFRALMSAEWTISGFQQAETIGCKVFNKPFNLDEMLKWLSNCQKQIDQKRVLSDWPARAKAGEEHEKNQ